MGDKERQRDNCEDSVRETRKVEVEDLHGPK